MVEYFAGVKYLEMIENEIARGVFEASLGLHRKFGPGLFESVYEELLCYELRKRGWEVERQKIVKVIYEGLEMKRGFRADLMIEGCVIVEIKSVEQLEKIHFKQIITYLKLTDIKLGLLINFNVDLLKDGFHRIANGL